MFKKTPLFASFQRLDPAKDRSVLFLYLLIYFVMAILVLKVFSSDLQKTFMEQFHLKDKSFVRWASLQPVPSMYNFNNEFWFSALPLDSEVLSGAEPLPGGAQHFWINHYPLRFLSFGLYRRYFNTFPESYLYLRSRYRAQLLETVYRIIAVDNSLKLELMAPSND